jgi:hypothetical protein
MVIYIDFAYAVADIVSPINGFGEVSKVVPVYVQVAAGLCDPNWIHRTHLEISEEGRRTPVGNKKPHLFRDAVFCRSRTGLGE